MYDGEFHQAGYDGLLAFCRLIDEPLEPHEKKIARAYFGEAREIVAVLPRGNKKTTLAAKVALHHLLTAPRADVIIGAASVAQARIAYERMRGFAEHPALADELVIRHLELRHEDDDGTRRFLRVVPSDGPRAHGLSSSLYVLDELWAHRDEGLYEACLTGLIKHPSAKLIAISTAAAQLDSPLGRLRARALAQPTTKRTGPLVESTGDVHWLEWSLPEDGDPDDMDAVKACNPAAYITAKDLERQRRAVTDTAFRQFHCNQWGIGEGSWLPAGAWQQCVGEPHFEPGEPIWIGVDLGDEWSASALVWVNQSLNVGCALYYGDQAVLDVAEHIRHLGATYTIREVAFDMWRAGQLAGELEREGVTVSAFPMTDVRTIPASARLHSAIVEQRITLPDEPELAKHAADAIAKHSRRGWRIDKPTKRTHIDGLIALMMAVDRVENQPAPAEVIGWL